MKIIIIGECAEGKTTVSRVIERVLKLHGAKAHNADTDAMEDSFPKGVTAEQLLAKFAEEKNLTVQIVTAQVGVDGLLRVKLTPDELASALVRR